MIKLRSFLLLACAITISTGTLVGQSINGIVNSYARVTAIAGNSFTVDNLSGDINDFESGKKVLIIQMKGADIDRYNGSTYGSILALNEAGNHEYAIVKEITGSGPFTLTLHSKLRSYDPATFVQIIAVPEYDDVTVSGELTALPWNRVNGTGGVLAIEVSGTLSLAANMNVSGKGFAGGGINPVSSGNGTDIATFVTVNNAISGQKGEGIAVYGAEGEFGMGPLANGGGGGNSHNGGGGGGGNFSDGGLGGESHYGGGGGGMPGKQIISASANSKLFMGGGGGGGQENNGNASPGGAGGGIILIRANKIVSDCGIPTRSILANGSHAANTTGNDGAGGGGAGGSILLDVNVFDLSCNADVLTNGGNGGNVPITQKHAGGGGGGAGAIFLPRSSGTAFTNFSSNSGTPGLDCTGAGCTSTGSPGVICVGDACDGDETWPDLPNSVPAALEDNVLTSQNAPVTIEVLNNDRDADFDDVLTVTSISGPSNGTISLTGNIFTYTPNVDFTGSDAFQYQVCDNGTPASCSIATANISIHSITLTGIENTSIAYTEGQLSAVITSSITINHVDNLDLASATITINSNYTASEDVLNFVDANDISGSWDAATGTLSLTGSASVADYQAALRSITYENLNADNPSNTIRNVSINVTDGGISSNTLSRDIKITSVNDAPDLAAIEATVLTFTEGDAAKQVTATLMALDVDNANITSADIKITANYSATEDLLAFTNANSITGSWNSTTGTLTLTGNATLANYQTAIRSITYQNINNGNPSAVTRTVRITINDGSLNSSISTRDIEITPVNDAPDLAAIEATALTFTEGDAAKQVTATLMALDVDNANITSAVIKITANYISTEDILAFTDANGITGSWDATTGTLILTGNAALVNYQTAIKSITYQNTNNNNPSAATRTVSITINDGSLNSSISARDIQIILVNDAPGLAAIEATAVSFTEGDAAEIITSSLTTSDGDNANLTSAVIRITANYVRTEDVLAFTDADGISGSWDAATAILTLTGSATHAMYEAALRTVTYRNTNNNNPSALTRTVNITVSDGSISSNSLTRNIGIIPVNDAPVAGGIESTALIFTEGDAAKTITSSLVAMDVDNANIGSALIKISNNYVSTEDVLGFTDANGITGSWDATTGTLILSGGAYLDYQAARDAVTYHNTNTDNPSALTRKISFIISDGSINSNTVTRDITIVPVNDAPAIAAIESTALSFTEGDAAKNITATLTASDVDNADLTSAVIKITSNYLNTEDILGFTDANGITGSWDAPTGALTLTGNATLANYQTALRSITYQNTNNGNPSAATRTVIISTNDGTSSSNTLTRDIEITPVDDAPVLAAIETTVLSFTEGDAAKIITATLAASDVDNANLAGAVAEITTNYVNTEDVLGFTDANGITGSWDAAAGTLTLSGNATLANYQTAIRSITYQNTNNGNPSALTRTVSITINDGSLNSNVSRRDIEITLVNDAPDLAAIEATALTFTEGDAAKALTATLTTSDVDNANLASAVVKITANYQNTEDVLAFTNANAITGNWDAATGILTLSGNTTLANYQTAIRSITYQNTNNGNPSATTRTVSITINDGSLNSNVSTRDIEITPVNDAPVLAAIEATALSFTEGDAAKIITSTLTGSDVDNANLSSAIVRITANYSDTEDVLTFTEANGITGSWDAATGSLTFTGIATLSNYQDALRSVIYQNINNNKPSIANRTITFTINDSDLNSNTVNREIIIIPVNDVPVPSDDVAATDKNVAVVINVLGNDHDVEGDALTVSAIAITPPVKGALVLNADQTFTYTPDLNFLGSDSFEYEICDNGNPVECSKAIVAITVNYKNYSPVAANDLIDIKEDEPINISVLANDSDPDLDEINVSLDLVTKPRFGKVELAENRYTYTPNPNYNGSDFFGYQICDNGIPSICTTALVNIFIEPVNDTPEPADDDYRNKDVISEIKGNVLENDYDIEADMLSVDLATLKLPSHGELMMKEDGSFSYMPNPGFFGEDAFEYFACDDGSPVLCTKATVALVISSGVPKGFSPNGDATNDEWIISGLEEYPMNSVVVMNRYGDLVFEMKGYDNASRVWRGEANSGLKVGSSDLPDGTYFYMINFGDGKSAEKGFVIIKR